MRSFAPLLLVVCVQRDNSDPLLREIMHADHEKYRAFVGLFPPPALQPGLRALRAALEELLPGGACRWTPHAQLHLTLAFLGNVRAQDLATLGDAVRGVVASHAPFELRLAGPGTFPEGGSPRVLWVGFARGARALEGLAASVRTVAAPFGDHRETRPFKPHLTLARFQRGRRMRPDFARHIREVQAPELPAWQITEVCLMRSVLAPAGATYSELGRYPLGAAESRLPMG